MFWGVTGGPPPLPPGGPPASAGTAESAKARATMRATRPVRIRWANDAFIWFTSFRAHRGHPRRHWAPEPLSRRLAGPARRAGPEGLGPVRRGKRAETGGGEQSATPGGERNGVFPSVCAQRPDGVADVRPDRLDADAELGRDLLIPESLPEMVEDLALALTECEVGRHPDGPYADNIPHRR